MNSPASARNGSPFQNPLSPSPRSRPLASPNLRFFSRPTHIQCQLPRLQHTHATNLAHSDSKPTPTSHPNNQLDTMPPSLPRSLHSSPKNKRKVDCHPLTTALGVAEDSLRLRLHWLLPGWIPEQVTCFAFKGVGSSDEGGSLLFIPSPGAPRVTRFSAMANARKFCKQRTRKATQRRRQGFWQQIAKPFFSLLPGGTVLSP